MFELHVAGIDSVQRLGRFVYAATTRDYFDVEDAEGKRFWLFRVNETGKWYVHGMFS